jgi:filamentous hemagglutinin
MPLPRIRGTQVGLRDAKLVDHLKAEIAAGRFAFHEERGQVGGVIDSRGTYHVIDGHHRMAAALELSRESGDDRPALTMLFWGRWSLVEKPPADSRPMPSRSTCGALRNWLGI